jgi:hypothetical protein
MAVRQFRNRTTEHQSQSAEQKYQTQSGANVEGDDEHGQPPAAAQMVFVVKEKIPGVHRAQHSSILAAVFLLAPRFSEVTLGSWKQSQPF